MDMDTSAALAVSKKKMKKASSSKAENKDKKRKRQPEDLDGQSTSSRSATRTSTSSNPDTRVPSTASSKAHSSRSSFAELHRPQKPSAKAKAGKGRDYTVSIALPGSILLNAQSPELRTYLAGQIARTCSIFSVDEIVVFHEPNHVAAAQQQQDLGHGGGAHPPSSKTRGKYRQTVSEQGSDDENDMDGLLCRILEYLEMPQYLRRALIPMHPSLRLAGLLPPLDMPHHLRKTDTAPFREGATIDRPPHYKPTFGQSGGTFVDVGLGEPVFVKTQVPTGQRVTVRMDAVPSLVPPSTPTSELGYAWGYNVRQAASISKVLLECPYEGGYDLTMGTSERGQDIAQADATFPSFRHSLIVFGGLAGLELTIEADADLGLSAEEAKDAFDQWLNICPNQGSRTIRTEEALMIALARLKTTFESKGM